MRRTLLFVLGAVVVGAAVIAQGPGGRGGRGGVAVKPGQECPPGTTLVRVGSCQAPEFPPPSIVDYRPTSSLEVAEHPVPRAKFPVVDIHSHTGPTPATIASLISQMDALNIRVLNNLSGGSGDALGAARHLHKKYAICESVHGVRKRAEPVSRRGRRLWPEGRGAARVGCEERRHRFQDFQRDRHGHDEGGRHPAEDQRSRARADLGDGGAAEHPGHHSYSRAAGVLQAARYAQRALARARAVRRSPQIPRARLIRIAQRGTRRSVREASEDALHLGALRMARQRSRPARRSCSIRIRTSSSSWRRSSTTWAGSRAPRTTSSSSTRIGFCSARTRMRPRNFRTTGACSRRGTSTSTITATTTRSGSCMAWSCRMRCSGRCITRTRGV